MELYLAINMSAAPIGVKVSDPENRSLIVNGNIAKDPTTKISSRLFTATAAIVSLVESL